MGMGMGAMAGLSLVFWLIGLFVLVLWILLPFAVFGVKPLITNAIAEAKSANVLLKQIVDQQRVLIEQQKLASATGKSSHQERQS